MMINGVKLFKNSILKLLMSTKTKENKNSLKTRTQPDGIGLMTELKRCQWIEDNLSFKPKIIKSHTNRHIYIHMYVHMYKQTRVTTLTQ